MVTWERASLRYGYLPRSPLGKDVPQVTIRSTLAEPLAGARHSAKPMLGEVGLGERRSPALGEEGLGAIYAWHSAKPISANCFAEPTLRGHVLHDCAPSLRRVYDCRARQRPDTRLTHS